MQVRRCHRCKDRVRGFPDAGRGAVSAAGLGDRDVHFSGAGYPCQDQIVSLGEEIANTFGQRQLGDPLMEIDGCRPIFEDLGGVKVANDAPAIYGPAAVPKPRSHIMFGRPAARHRPNVEPQGQLS